MATVAFEPWILPASIRSDHIASAQVLSGHIADAQILGRHVASAQIDASHMVAGVIKPIAALPILTASESNSSTTLTTTNQRTMWRGSLMNMARVVKVECEVDWASGGAGDLDLYNVTDSAKIADLATPSAATARATVQYDVTSQMKAITADKVVALQIKGDGTNALTVYRASLLIYMSLG